MGSVDGGTVVVVAGMVTMELVGGIDVDEVGGGSVVAGSVVVV